MSSTPTASAYPLSPVTSNYSLAGRPVGGVAAEIQTLYGVVRVILFPATQSPTLPRPLPPALVRLRNPTAIDLRKDATVVVVLPCNQPPVAEAEPDQAVECTSPAGAQVSLDGTGSSDPDVDPLTFYWTDTSIVFDDPAGPTPSATFPLEITTATLTVTEPDGLSDAGTKGITVQDTTPPTPSLGGSFQAQDG